MNFLKLIDLVLLACEVAEQENLLSATLQGQGLGFESDLIFV